MKKFMIAFVAVFLTIGVAIASMLIGASRVSRYLRESNDHLRDAVAHYGTVCAEQSGEDAPRVELSLTNVNAFIEAVNRSALVHRYLPPKGKEGITVTFADGAEYTVVDGGEDKSGKDVAYIIYRYQRHTYYFSLTGLRTYERVSQCVSPEGFGEENRVLVQDAA